MKEQTKKLEFWLKHAKAWPLSGLTKEEYCINQSISRHTFSYWQRKLKAASSGPGLGSSQRHPRRKSGRTVFVEAAISEENMKSESTEKIAPIILRIGRNINMEIPLIAKPEWIASLLIKVGVFNEERI